MLYRLHNDCPVKWTAVQERSISREFPALASDATAEDQTLRTYHQFLWLPESLVPLSRVAPALRRVATRSPGPALEASASPPASSSLCARLAPLLQPPRAVAQKYRTRLPRLLAEEEAEGDDEAGPEDDIMWYALKHDRADPLEDEDEEAADERWRQALPDRMERREVMMQILVHLLLLTEARREPPRDEHAAPLLGSPPSPDQRRRRRSHENRGADTSREALEEQLEMYMDKLAMWQLMGSLDEGAGGGGAAKSAGPSAQGKGRAADDRDWMQAFCEDVVEAQFRALLPEQCDLLRSKVFRSSPFADGSDDLASPPGSPKGRAKAPKPPRTASRPDAQLARSLSVTLEEERVRARSRSLSVGPQRRALVREVSMSTAFRGKARPAAQSGRTKPAPPPPPPSRPSVSRHGTTLVAATPVKPKQRAPLQSAARDRLPMLLDNPEFLGRAVEGGEDDGEWMIQSSPDIVFLGGGGGGRGESRVLAEATPTKKRRTS